MTSTQPPVAPAKSGSSAVKIILIVVAIFVGLGIIGAGMFGFAVWRVAHAFHVSGNGSQVTVNTGNGTISTSSTDTISASDLGIDIYPGAQSGKGSMRMNLPTGSMISASFVTPDSKSQVLEFYKGKLGNAASVIDTNDGAIITLSQGERESVMVTIVAKANQFDGKTQIHIVHSKNDKHS